MKKKTHEEYVAEVAAINPNIEVIGTYINARTKILHKCKIDNHEWYVAPTTILSYHGCPVCYGTPKKTHEEYVTEVYNINSNIEVIEEYVDSRTKILHRCNVDGYEWYARPDDILHKHGCPKCSSLNSGKKRAMPHDEYIERVAEIDSNIEVVGKYVNALTPILHKCKIDECEWNARPSTILRGHGCPKCNASKGEKAVAAWLNKKEILYNPQKTFDDCKYKCVLRFDFYLPNYNILIEYNGRQHYEPVDCFGGEDEFKNVVRRDKIKENYCKENNIRLFIIPYFEDINMKFKELSDLIIAKEVAA